MLLGLDILYSTKYPMSQLLNKCIGISSHPSNT